MIKLLPFVLVIAWTYVMVRFSAWRTREMLARQSVPLIDPALQPALSQLARALDLPRIDVRIFEVEPVNGLAAPDGKIYLTRGFYQRFQDGAVSAEELAGVIAHELGHVALGHTRKRMIDFTGQNAIRLLLATILGRLVPVVGVLIANVIATALAARLSRADELEADAWAAALMVKAGFGITPQVSLFRKLTRLTGTGQAQPPAWLMSHPATDERIAAIEKLSAGWDGPGGRA